MPDPTTAPYGSWDSPITADVVIAGTVPPISPAFDQDYIYWAEMRAQEGGGVALVRRSPAGTVQDVVPASLNVRSRAHELGGGAFLVDQGVVYFSSAVDGKIYSQIGDGDPAPLTPVAPYRFADLVVDRARNRLICVREDMSDPHAPVDTIVAIDLQVGGAGDVLVSGADFYSTPRVTPDGSRLCWLAWNHPNMPWDGTELWLAAFDAAGKLQEPALIAGGPDESVFQPEWAPNGTLYFVSDRSGWWNLYRRNNGQDENLYSLDAEFGRAQWGFGMRTYAIAADKIVCSYIERGVFYLALLDPNTRELKPFKLPYEFVGSVQATKTHAVFLAGSPSAPLSVVVLDLASGEFEVLHRASNLDIDPSFFSASQPIEFPSANGQTAFGFYYAPRNPNYTAPDGDKPPLLVLSHGGPTGMTTPVFSPSLQYWTSRGFGVLDVNYSGSEGFGRAYRRLLYGRWGILDVEDCISGAQYLVRSGAIDPDRLIIAGGSAGGFTTLCALTFHDLFKAGVSSYGIGDLELLAKETHKFESHYTDELVGPYPQAIALYHARSPIRHVEGLSAPVIFFQGLEDRIVPPSQAETMVNALRRKGTPVAYITFAGEGHGFRQAAHQKRVLEAELYFFSRIFKFDLPLPIEPVEIDNLSS